MDLSDPAPEESRLMAFGRLQAGANTTLGAGVGNTLGLIVTFRAYHGNQPRGDNFP